MRPTQTAAPGEGAPKLSDGFNNTWWRAPDGSLPVTIHLMFNGEATVRNVILTSGIVDQPGVARPKRISVQVGGAKAQELLLADGTQPQTLTLKERRGSTLDLQVLEAYPGEGPVAITDIEVFGKPSRRLILG